nr:hypothetical protein [Paracidobacterium acidisoli]
MRSIFVTLLACTLSTALASAQSDTPGAEATPTQLTIYNGDFAVARTTVDLSLNPGSTEITTTDVTRQLEPDSVVLRDPSGKHAFTVSEQNYDAAVVNQQWLLQKYEGRTIDFQAGSYIDKDTGKFFDRIVSGKIIRAGDQPLIEVNGKMQFQLPGTPLFPATTDGLLLKPTLRWQIHSERAEHFPAELDYITHGLNWEATYNIVVPESTGAGTEDQADVLGWITIHNNSGTEFPQAAIKLMAGDVAKLTPPEYPRARAFAMNQMVAVSAAPEVTQKAFDDFHLYDLHRTVTLRDGETKQVQFLEASDVTVKRTYEYDGSGTFYPGFRNEQADFGAQAGNTQVRIVQAIKNSKANHLGIPLPAGRIRVYRRDTDGQMEFVGESTISHTPSDETVQISTGNAFDLKGERKQTDFHIDARAGTIDESFEITLKNQKEQPVTINVVEHLYRWNNWQITQKSGDFTKRDSDTIVFPVTVPSKGQSTLTYTVHYTW